MLAYPNLCMIIIKRSLAKQEEKKPADYCKWKPVLRQGGVKEGDGGYARCRHGCCSHIAALFIHAFWSLGLGLVIVVESSLLGQPVKVTCTELSNDHCRGDKL